jgi:hypothetical protein
MATRAATSRSPAAPLAFRPSAWVAVRPSGSNGTGTYAKRGSSSRRSGRRRPAASSLLRSFRASSPGLAKRLGETAASGPIRQCAPGVGRRVRIRQSDLDELVHAGITTEDNLKEPRDAPAIDENLPERLWAELYARLSEAHAAKANGSQASLISALRSLGQVSVSLAETLDETSAITNETTVTG